jgi:hypothetical protein
VLDAFGQRWAVDLGPDDYNLPNYFGRDRFNYYRLRTESHNTLTIDDQNQNPKAAATVLAYHSTRERALAVADLTSAYEGATRVRRGIEFTNRSQLIVQDEVELAAPANIVWNMQTQATVIIAPDGASVLLSQNQAKLAAMIISPAGARFECNPVAIPKPQRATKGLSRLQVTLPEKVRMARIVVVLGAPEVVRAARAPATLDEWIKAAAN